MFIYLYNYTLFWAGIGDCIFVWIVFYMNKKYIFTHLYIHTLLWAGIGDCILVLIVFYMLTKYTFIYLYIYTLCCTSYVSEGVTSYPRSSTWCSCPVKMFMFLLFLMVTCPCLVKMFKREMFARAAIEHLHKQVCRQELLTCLFKMFTKQVAMLICLYYKLDLSLCSFCLFKTTFVFGLVLAASK